MSESNSLPNKQILNLNFRQKIALQNARKLHALKKQVAVEHSLDGIANSNEHMFRSGSEQFLKIYTLGVPFLSFFLPKFENKR